MTDQKPDPSASPESNEGDTSGARKADTRNTAKKAASARQVAKKTAKKSAAKKTASKKTAAKKTSRPGGGGTKESGSASSTHAVKPVELSGLAGPSHDALNPAFAIDTSK